VPDDQAPGYRIIDLSPATRADERAAVVAGLLERPARISPMYFYDELGCALYAAICRLPEYYPTRTEMAIFGEHRAAMAEAMGSGRQLVDLGAGDCRKAEGWLALLAPARYIAVDIAADEIAGALARLAADFPGIDMVGVVTDFSRGLDIESALDAGPATFLYPGSSIGNFMPEDAVAFLASIRRHCVARPGSGLLIGVDGKKPKPVLDAAYDDPLGVTAAFNRNALSNLNRRFGFDFRIEGFAHRGFYNEALGRIEMHLESLADQEVALGSAVRRFRAGERIHTENSYKYHAAEFEGLLGNAGFGAIRRWSDRDGGYFVFYAS
jgi:dimethylhistidine N-methyltransferase